MHQKWHLGWRGQNFFRIFFFPFPISMKFSVEKGKKNFEKIKFSVEEILPDSWPNEVSIIENFFSIFSVPEISMNF